jgi:hypothetical protein
MADFKLIKNIKAYVGASGDTKTTGVAIGSKAYEYDTGKWYITYDGTNWIETSDDNTNVTISKQTYGAITTAHNAIAVTTTSNEIDITGYNAVLVGVAITGTGTWKIDLQGRLDTNGTVMDVFDNNDNQLTTGNITVSRLKLFTAVPSLIKIVATEVADGATCTVRVQPLNI